MFFKKKEEKGKLPDLPPLPATNFLSKAPSASRNEGLSALNVDDASKKEDVLGKEVEDIDSMVIEKHSLPSFPDSPMEKGFSQAVIKDAIDDNSKEELPELPESPSNLRSDYDSEDTSEEVVGADSKPKVKLVEADSSTFKPSESSKWYSPSNVDVPEKKEVTRKVEIKPVFVSNKQEKAKEIYVRIDKYQTARKSLNEIDFRLGEIGDLLKKIRETKLREEQELNAWDEELNSVKNKLKDVTQNIFEKLE